MKAKEKAIEIAESLKGVKTSDNVIQNIENLCDYVLDALQSVTGSQKHMMSVNEIEVTEFWKEVKKEAKNLKF